MSKSSKKKKRIKKLIRGWCSIDGKDNLEYEDFCQNFNQYCNKKFDFYRDIFNNKELHDYYKNVMLPQQEAVRLMNMGMWTMSNQIKQSGVTAEQLNSTLERVSKMV